MVLLHLATQLTTVSLDIALLRKCKEQQEKMYTVITTIIDVLLAMVIWQLVHYIL